MLGGRRGRGDLGFDASLGLIGELRALRPEELDPVVAVGVVRGRDHDREVESVAAQKEGRSRGRQNSAQQGMATGSGDPGGQRRLEHVTRLAGVPNDQDLWLSGF